MKYSHEYEFLPAALEVQETPPSPIGRFIIWTLLLLTVIAIVWAMIGQVDIVATAQGKIIPGGRDKIIQPLEIGVVRKIHVQEGQYVEKGDLLVELDTTASGADETRMQHELILARFEAARLRALIDDKDQGATVFGEGKLATLKETAPEIFAMQARLLQSEQREDAANESVLENDIIKRQAELNVIHSILDKLQATLPLVTERVRILPGELGQSTSVTEEFVALLRAEALLVEGKHPFPSLPGPDDEPIIASALTGQAHVFVTGDKALLKLQRVEHLPVISPRQFWELLAGRETY